MTNKTKESLIASIGVVVGIYIIIGLPLTIMAIEGAFDQAPQRQVEVISDGVHVTGTLVFNNGLETHLIDQNGCAISVHGPRVVRFPDEGR